MSNAMKLLNKYELEMILKSKKTDFNNFYKSELIQLLELAREILMEKKTNKKQEEKWM